MERYAVLDSYLQDADTVTGNIKGTVMKQTFSGTSYRILLKDVKIFIEHTEVFTSNLIVYFSNEVMCHAGDCLEAEGMVQEIASPENPGQFSMKSYYLSQNVYYSCTADRIRVVNQHKKYMEYIEACKKRLQAVYETHLSQEDASVILAMVLGEQGGLADETRDLYQNVGISHILAISGLHISVIGLFFYGILDRLYLPRAVSSGITMLVLYAYMLMTGAGVATKRAVLMMCLFFISKIVCRTYDLLSALAFSALFLFVQAPYVIFQSGFLLSFSAILGVSVLKPALQSALGSAAEVTEEEKRRRHRDKKERRANKRLPSLHAVGSYIEESVINLLFASLGIQLMICPVLAFTSYRIPLYGIFLNLLVLPFMSMLLIFAVSGGILGCLYLPLGAVMTVPVHGILQWYEKAASFFFKLPGNLYVTGQPAIWQMVLYYTALCFFAGSVYIRGMKEKNKENMKISLLFLLPLCVIFLPVHYRGLQVAFLSVGQGDGIVMRAESGTVYMIDGGSSTGNLEKYCLTPYLLSQGISCIDYAIVTHPDEDHVSGLKDIIKKSGTGGVSIKTLILPKISFRDEAYEQMETLANENNVKIQYMQKGDRLTDGRLSLFCLHPEKDIVTDDRNVYSTTLYLSYGEISMLFTGDLPKEEEEGVLEEWKKVTGGGQKGCGVLKVAHHGSKYSTGKEFLDMLRPSFSVISYGRKNRYGHPHKELVSRLEEAGSVIAGTADYGAVTVYTDGKTLTVETFR